MDIQTKREFWIMTVSMVATTAVMATVAFTVFAQLHWGAPSEIEAIRRNASPGQLLYWFAARCQRPRWRGASDQPARGGGGLRLLGGGAGEVTPPGRRGRVALRSGVLWRRLRRRHRSRLHDCTQSGMSASISVSGKSEYLSYSRPPAIAEIPEQIMHLRAVRQGACGASAPVRSPERRAAA
jgi:hypothetical protein